MCLTRLSSGLLLLDLFDTDTSADYETSGGTVSVSGGALSIGANGWVQRLSITGVGCSTVVGSRESGRNACPWLGQATPITTAANQDGYDAAYNNTSIYFRKITNGAAADIGSNHFATNGAATTRSYYTASGVVIRCGSTAGGVLNAYVSVADTTYTAKNYGGIFFYGNNSLVVYSLELRTSYLIACSGMTDGHYLRVSDGVSTPQEAVASGGSASVDAGAVLFPLASVQIRTAAAGGGDLIAEITSATLTDMGGGDAFTYTEDFTQNNKEITTDSLIKATQQYDFDVDGRIKDTSTILLATDAIVKAIEEATITADGRIMATGQKDITVDSLVKSRLLEEFETDALITERTVKSITADGRIKDVVETTITTNADVVDRLVKEFMADGYIRATTDYGITADGRIKVVSTETFTVDGIIRFNVIGVTGEAFWIELIGKSKWIELVGKAKFNEGG